MTREIVPATDRKGMTPARRQRALDRHDGHCGWPGCEVRDGLEIDHAICLGLGGKEADENLIPLCKPHHRIKTDRDLKLIAKARRRRQKAGLEPLKAKRRPKLKSRNTWPPPKSRKIAARPFPVARP